MRNLFLGLAALGAGAVLVVSAGCLQDFDKFEGTLPPADAAPEGSTPPPPPPPPAAADGGADAAVEAGPCRSTPAACTDPVDGCNDGCNETAEACDDACTNTTCRFECIATRNRCRGDCRRTCEACALDAGTCPDSRCD